LIVDGDDANVVDDDDDVDDDVDDADIDMSIRRCR
jgi:hypothetical protein